MKFDRRLVWGAALWVGILYGIAADTSTNKDSDYDGRTDAQEAQDGTNPQDANSVIRVRLAHWTFDQSDWQTDDGRSPLRAEQVRGAPSFDGQALQVTNTKGAGLLLFRDVEADGRANINCRSGCIR